MVYAIAAKHAVLVFDTQQPYPIAKVSDIHYTKLSDISWSSDGRILIVSSTDGYCTFVLFGPNELGETYDGPAYQYQSPVKETTKKREKKEKEEKEQVEPPPVVDKVPETAKITNFFKKLPAGTPVIVKPIVARKSPSNGASLMNPVTTSGAKVNHLQVKRLTPTVVDTSKQPRRMAFTTLVSKPIDNKATSEVLKETLNTKQESDTKESVKMANVDSVKDVEMTDGEIIKPEDDDLKATEKEDKTNVSMNGSFVKENQVETNGDHLTPQRNKRKPENGGTPEDVKQSAKKRINLIKIE
jgi:chromatin assembly factor 1 subunit B